MRASTTAILFGAATLAAAQQQYTIDPSNVPFSTRNTWCNNQKTSCPLICLQTPGNVGAEKNDCDPNSLQYTCVCTNGQSPNLTEYTQTLPYFICTEWGNECVSNCGNNNLCQADCLQKHPCGAQSPDRKNVTTSSASTASKTGTQTSTLSTTATAGTIYTGLAGNAAASTSPSSAAAATFQPTVLQFGQVWGMAVIVAGLFGGFAVML
ncbi:hypothetical protein AMS68_001918 [Peltaster fructicola]|uniref:DUF7707 domain-containing protein n=1 Tax=Peltaster fructicola TaxID=286661 RepID=A0A6H0XP18_9PEZI|nr:hypothetical protein AMS68_001918 [Peltaster fructicola]